MIQCVYEYVWIGCSWRLNLWYPELFLHCKTATVEVKSYDLNILLNYNHKLLEGRCRPTGYCQIYYSSLFMQPYMRLCGCSVCGDFWPPTGTERRPSSAGGRRWGPGRETTPLTHRRFSVFCIRCWADARCSENSRRFPKSRDLITRRDNSSAEGWETKMLLITIISLQLVAGLKVKKYISWSSNFLFVVLIGMKL